TIIAHLQQLALCVTADVNEHSSRMNQINGELQIEGGITAEAVLSRIEDIIQANEHLKRRLAETENRLREQTKIIEAQATEVRTDSLTHVVNRRGFDEELHRRFSESKRHGAPLSVVMLDLDQFKRLNDEHGHQAGDEVLRGVGGVLIQTMRCSDLVSRYGGEEFAIILPNTPLEDALLAAERARHAIERKQLRFEGKDLRVTASLGVAQLRSSENTPLLVRRADEALYASKRAGRNKTHWHDGRSVRPASYHNASDRPDAADGSQNLQGTRAETAKFAGESASRLPKSAEDTNKRPWEPQPDTTDVSPPHAPDVDLSQCNEDSKSQYLELQAAAGCAANRMEFCRAVQCRLGEWKRGGDCFSVVLLSIFHRQRSYLVQGNPQGEFSPRALHTALTTVVREMDLVAQFKPGCFGVLLPAVDQNLAGTLAQRLRHAIEACFSSAASEVDAIIIAVGLAEVAEGDDMVRLLTRTEEALQSAVREGRSGCFRHNGQWTEPVARLADTTAP
ncbi:MAG: diguanylate cyclase, partial [Thermoguttaceae bacterium]